jgi:hypothetical protein
MGDQKTLRQRVDEEIPNFSKIYSSYVAAHKAKEEERGAGSCDPWLYAFDIPYESEPQVYATEIPQKDLSERHEAVVATVRAMRLDELRLGGTLIKDERIRKALDRGFLTLDDLAPLYTLPWKDQEARKIGPVIRFRLDRRDPFFWRTLLEVFCRAYAASSGPRGWSMTRKVDFAFDLDEIRRKLPNKKWHQRLALEMLRKEEPYKTKYPVASGHKKARAGIGQRRIKEITDWIGPMDDDALERLKMKCEAVFFEVADRRWEERRRSQEPRTLDEIERILGEAESLGEAAPVRI